MNQIIRLSGLAIAIQIRPPPLRQVRGFHQADILLSRSLAWIQYVKLSIISEFKLISLEFICIFPDVRFTMGGVMHRRADV